MSILKILMLLLFVFLSGCSKHEEGQWYLDSTFSNHLLSFSELYRLRTKHDPMDAVDVLQIFKVDQGKAALTNVDKIRSHHWIYETSKREEIAVFLYAARNFVQDTKVGCKPSNDVVYFILAFDRDLMRVGLLKYLPCTTDDMGALTSYGSESLYFSPDFAKIIGRIMGSELHKPERKFGGLGSWKE